jgi:hypothetical protein
LHLARPPDSAFYDDEVERRIKARDLHGTKRGIGPRISPVQKLPTSV